MKRLLAFAFIFMLILALSIGLAACNPEHVHNFGDWIEETPASCTQEGLMVRVCADCGEREEQHTDLLPHTPVTVDSVPATCTAPGRTGRTYCSVCLTPISDDSPIEALGHSYGEYNHVEEGGKHYHSHACTRVGCDSIEGGECTLSVKEISATCFENACTVTECSVCGYSVTLIHENTVRAHKMTVPVFDPKTHTHTSVCEYEDCDYVATAECDFESNTVLPSCESQGYTRYTCSECLGYYDDDIKDALGHSYGIWVVDEPATCSTKGKQHRDCQNCDEIEYEDIETTEHVLGEWELKVSPSCTEMGRKELSCVKCGSVIETEQLDMLPHSYGEEWQVEEQATCTKEGKEYRQCTECGYKLNKVVDKLPHSLRTLDGYAATCTNEGLTNGEQCEVCNTVVSPQVPIQPLGHDWEKVWTPDPAMHTHSRKCQRTECNETDVKTCAGIVQDTPATCLDDGYAEFNCVDCGQYYKDKTTDALGHDFTGSYFERTVSAEDGIEGADMQGAHRHTHYQICRRANCGVEKSEDCELELDPSLSREANCWQAQIKVEVCPKCRSRHETVLSPALGHNWGDYMTGGLNDRPYHYRKCQRCNASDYPVFCTFETLVHQPTCDEQGYTERKCTECSYSKKSNMTEALGHILGGYEYSGDLETHTHIRKCQREDCQQIVVSEACTMVPFENAATCSAAGGSGQTCKYCKVNITEETYQQLDHVWSIISPKTDETHRRICQNCKLTEDVEHSYDETIIPADCEHPGYNKKVCRLCQHEYTVQLEDQLALGHSWSPWEITDDTHKSQCATCKKVVDGAHVYEDSNICKYCSHDGMEYFLQGDHYIVKKNAALSNVKSIIIKPYHSSVEDPTLHPVTEIDAYVFHNFKNLQTVELPFTLEKIGKWAFDYCIELKDVYINEEVRISHPEGEDEVRTMEANLKIIGEYAFNNDKSLVSFEAPASLLEIGNMAFSDCIMLTNIDLPDTLEDLGYNVFRNTAYLKDESKWQGDSIYIGKHLIYARHLYGDDGSVSNKKIVVKSDTVTIAANAFENCTAMEEVELPKTLRIVDKDAFINCVSLKKVVFDGNMNDWFAINFVNDFSSPLHYATEMHINEESSRVEIPEGITRIPAGTFRNTEIREVSIPSTVTYIGANAFAGCSLLETITIDDNVIYIGKDAFKDTAYMLNPDKWDSQGALYVGNHLVATDPTRMKGSYTLKAETVTIGIEAFANCVELESIVIPANVKRIGANAFEGCTALVRTQFEGNKEFFANSIKLGISRVLDYARSLGDATDACKNLKIYNGEWVWQEYYGKY